VCLPQTRLEVVHKKPCFDFLRQLKDFQRSEPDVPSASRLVESPAPDVALPTSTAALKHVPTAAPPTTTAAAAAACSEVTGRGTALESKHDASVSPPAAASMPGALGVAATATADRPMSPADTRPSPSVPPPPPLLPPPPPPTVADLRTAWEKRWSSEQTSVVGAASNLAAAAPCSDDEEDYDAL